MHQPDRISYLLNRYLCNTCTRQEMDELLDHVQRYPGDENLRAVLEECWDNEGSSNNLQGPAWNEMQHRMREIPFHKRTVDMQKFLWKIAASFFVVAACFAGFFFLWENRDALFASQELRHVNSVDATVNNTTKDAHRLVVLSDGSKVWINGNSKLVSPETFNGKTREVALYGEAFFDIRHDPARPFIIKTGPVKTTVPSHAMAITSPF
jgi:transmembrane sensor